MLKTGTSDSCKDWFAVGEYKKLPNEVGSKEWNHEKGYLIDTCLTAQDRFKVYSDYFRIDY